MRPCASHPIDSTFEPKGRDGNPSRPLLLMEAPGGATDYYTLCTAVCGFHGAPNVTRPPPVAAPRDALAALDRRKFRPRPLNVALPGVTRATLQSLRPQTWPFPKCRPRPDAARAPLPGVVYTPLDAARAPFQAPHVSSLCDWLSKMCGVYRQSGPIREFRLFVIWGFTLAVSSLHNSGQINPTHFQFDPGFPLI